MKQTSKKKLALKRDTIRTLESGLEKVFGGIVTTSANSCGCPSEYCTNGCPGLTDACPVSQGTKAGQGCDGSIVREP